MQKLAEKLTEISLSLGILGKPAAKVLTAVAVAIAGIIVIKLVLRIIRKTLEHSNLDEVLHRFILNCAKVCMSVILFIVVCSSLGMSMAPFVTVLGAGGAAVALALKDSLGNFAGGIIIILNKPFSKGDLIETNGVEGRVSDIDLMSSKLVTLDNKVITIPNGLLATNVVVNYSHQTFRRIDCGFSIGYSSDIELAKSTVLDIVADSEMLCSDPEPVVGIGALGESGIDMQAFVWCRTEDYFSARRYLLEKIKNEFDRLGIEIPFPQLTVRMEGSSAADIPQSNNVLGKE